MKKKDLIFIICLIAFFSVFAVFEDVLSFYKGFNKEHAMITSFIKFAVLATLGEIIGLRVKSGNYNRPGFGIIPRAIVWGFLGLAIKIAFVIFYVGAPVWLNKMGVTGIVEAMKSTEVSGLKFLGAFTISTTMNLIFAPVMMTFHKITDTHIEANGGTLRGFFTPINFRKIFIELNWDVQWNFVFKKTIPFFWIPAHTITFLLPVDYQVLFAAILGIALGLILAIASMKSK